MDMVKQMSSIQLSPWRSRNRRRRVRLMRLAVAGALALMLIWGEDWLVYRRGGRYHPPLPGFVHEEVWLHASDGVRLHAWFCPCPPEWASPKSERLTILYFHGTFGELTWRQGIARDWQASLGCDVLLFDYRGYGRSGGRPSEEGLYRDARAAYHWLIKEQAVDPTRIVLVGRSLGGAVALELASEVEPRALVLESTFTSLPEAAEALLLGLPVGLLMRNRFPSLQRIENFRGPVFLAHSEADEVISKTHSVELWQRSRGPKELFILPSQGHGEQPGPEFYAAATRFLATHPR